MGECFFWYWPTRVVPDKGPLIVCVCVCVCARVALLTMIAVFQAVVLSTLLYGCESWVLYRRSVRRLDEFHMRCLRKIAAIK